MPWKTFPIDVQNSIENMIVSFKQNLRVISKSVNKYKNYDENGERCLKKQEKGDNIAIRKPMHKETIYGLVDLREVQLKLITFNVLEDMLRFNYKKKYIISFPVSLFGKEKKIQSLLK